MEHPTFVIVGIGLAITLAIGASMGILDYNQAFAARCNLNAYGCV